MLWFCSCGILILSMVREGGKGVVLGNHEVQFQTVKKCVIFTQNILLGRRVIFSVYIKSIPFRLLKGKS